MDQQSTAISGLAGVQADLVYLAPMQKRPHSYTYDPPPGVPRTNTVDDPHLMTIHDARPVAANLSLDREGFELVEYRSAVRDFYDEDELRRVYYPEAERLVAKATGATHVIIFDHTIRRRSAGRGRSHGHGAASAGHARSQRLHRAFRAAADSRPDG